MPSSAVRSATISAGTGSGRLLPVPQFEHRPVRHVVRLGQLGIFVVRHGLYHHGRMSSFGGNARLYEVCIYIFRSIPVQNSRAVVSSRKGKKTPLFDVRLSLKGHKNGCNHSKHRIFPEHTRSLAKDACGTPLFPEHIRSLFHCR